jgi:hypothetical protein
MDQHTASETLAADPAMRTIFDLLTAYHRSLENMRSWLDDAPLSRVERIGIIDAWQEEMREFFEEHGYCFGCNRRLDRCSCEEPSLPD